MKFMGKYGSHTGTDYSIEKRGIDYFYLLIKHLDRMSDGLRGGLDVGVINTDKLVAYYQQIMHFESLIVPFLDEKYYQDKKKWAEKIPGFQQTWSGEISDQIYYFQAISNIFQLLMMLAYMKGVLKIKRLPEHSEYTDDIL